MKLVVVAVLAAAAFVTVALSGVGRPDAARGEDAPQVQRNDTVTVNGTGKIESVPDRAEASFGVVTRAETAQQAAKENAERMRRVIDALRDAGVADKDIRTQELALMPHYDKDAQGITGYEASNTVVASSRLEKVGAALDAAVAAGANRSYGLTLARSDRDELYRKALAAAFDDARAKAEAIAAKAGVTLGAPVAVVEGGGGGPIAYGESAAALDRAVPIEAGSQQIQAFLTVTFAIS